MNQRELSEIRRRLRSEKNNITHIYGCYVNSNRELISQFDESLGLLSKEETEMYMNLLRKSLSGSFGRTLFQLNFSTRQVMDSEEHRLLLNLRKTQLEDESLRSKLYERIIQSLDPNTDHNTLILLAYDVYDVIHRGKDGHKREETDSFPYIVCCICPVKSRNPELKYDVQEGRFANAALNQLVCAPVQGFLFPSFDDRMANIYSSLLYTKGSEEMKDALVEAVFHTEAPATAVRQQEGFQNALAEAMHEDCRFELVESVHEQLTDLINAHKESKDPEPLVISVEELGDMLENCGVKREQAEDVRKKCAEDFGGDALLYPANLIGSQKIEITTAEMKLIIQPQCSHLVQAKVIDGQKYLMIAIPESVEFNGINVEI